MCSAKKCFFRIILLLCIHSFTEAAWLRCYKGSIDEFVEEPLGNNVSPTLKDCIDRNIPILFYTFGYKGKRFGPATTAVLTTQIGYKKRVVVLVDWEEEASSGMLGIPLGYALSAVPNAKKIGKKLGDTLVYLAKEGISMTSVHLVGHSLGAHVMAFAGRAARGQGHVVSRITGLDPARALFDGSFAIHTGLDRTCARFVDIIHTDPGGYGTSRSSGTVDIWPNYRGKKAYQPGCEDGEFEAFSPEDLCRHNRAWQYYVEAITSPTSFPAVYAPDYETWAAGNVNNSKTTFLGDVTNTRAQGNYYLTTNEKPPFGRGVDGLRADENQSPTPRESTLTRFLKYLR